ncbi:hypothetical protein KQI49_05450 [Virgibacillus sp. MSJ-26]|uniref:hypothetical protein n=1 Tax=Virgibacillus sp. MSJ-26 TaxID=2841522 RepID=UPI001C10AAF1|nr:hypothetical protein [Virgibacillus sp. MSJ-26]MBU5466277.1 hypothetical protein [Virgibacillus sp. MSJ-26]
MSSMNLYRGKLVVDIVTAVKTNDEKAMLDQAHEGFATELFDEIMALLGAKGYITQSIGATLENMREAHDYEVEQIEKDKLKSIDRANSVYNKANRITIKFD